MQRTDANVTQDNRQGQPDAPGISFFRWVLLGVMLLGFAFGTYGPAAGQAAATLTVDAPQTVAFPEMVVEFKLTDSTGRPIRSIEAAQLTVIENDQELPVATLSEIYRGVYFALVINGDREMDLRDAAGLSRYEKLADALQTWAAGWHFSGEDAWALMTNEGAGIEVASNAAAWMTALDAYQPNFRQLEPDLMGLEEALQMLQKAGASFGVGKSVLYITPPPAPDQIAGVTALTEQARQSGIQVNVWMVGEALYLANDQGGALIELAASTGGQFFHYTGAETIPDLTGALTDLGYAAQLTYTSALRAPGTYSLAIRAALPELDVTGEAQPFYLNILPPNPILLAPPVSIVREPVPSIEEDDPGGFTPAKAALQILIEFPDGRPRALAASRLLVDGSVAAVNTQAPFDSFTWDLTELTESGEHTIQVEVEDMLGLSAATLLTPVQIEILEPEATARFSLQQIALIAAGGVAGAGLVLLAAWLVRKFWRANQPRCASHRLEAAAAARPPAPPKGEERRYATLLPLDSVLEPGEDVGLPITRSRVLVGSDPRQADLHLDAPGVDPIQAELTREEGGFWLRHLGLHNPTWRNYKEVGPERVPLKAGDILHFGDCGFRFTINDDTASSKITVTRFEPF